MQADPSQPDPVHVGRGLVTVSIVSHGQLALILPLLEQLDRYSARLIDRVVLTTNIPEDDSLVRSSWHFALERVRNEAPLGFGANHN